MGSRIVLRSDASFSAFRFVEQPRTRRFQRDVHSKKKRLDLARGRGLSDIACNADVGSLCPGCVRKYVCRRENIGIIIANGPVCLPRKVYHREN